MPLPQGGWSDLPARPRPLRWADTEAWLRALLSAAGADCTGLTHEFHAASHEPALARMRRQLHDIQDTDPGLRLLQGAVPFLGPRLWATLAEVDRGQLLSHHFRTIVSLCCPMSPNSARALLTLADQGQLTLHSGAHSVTPGPHGGFTIHTTNSPPLNVHHVINAAGTMPDRIPTAAVPLISSLLTAGLAQLHPHGGLRVDSRTSQLLTRHGPDPCLYALGDLTMGTFLFTFGIPALVERAHEISTALTVAPQGAVPERILQP